MANGKKHMYLNAGALVTENLKRRTKGIGKRTPRRC